MITKRVFYGSSGYSVARHAAPLLGMYRVIKVSQYQGRVLPFTLLVHDVNAIASFPVGHAPILHDRNSHNLIALRAFERDLKRLVCVVKSCGVECPLSTFGAPHGNIHRNSSCCMLLT
jgi:hypothetical protein